MQTFKEPTLTFPAVRGIQAGREFYSAMCQLRLVPRLFMFDEEGLRPELRAQRTLNRARIPEITRYLVDNADSYIFSALTASIDGDVEFTPVTEGEGGYNIGRLVIPLTARLLINDGQHRRAAIEDAIKVRPELGDEAITVVFFLDSGLQRSQQMFADLNTHAVRPSMSIGILYNHRDPVAALARDLARLVPAFNGRIEMEKTTISNRSTKLFTLSALYQSTSALLGKGDGDSVSVEECHLATQFWTRVTEVIPEWRQVMAGRISAGELRAEYVHAHGVALLAIGLAGGALIRVYPNDWSERLKDLGSLDWRRTDSVTWEGRALMGGRVSKAHQSVVLTTALLKRILELTLSHEEERAESELQERERMRDKRPERPAGIQLGA